MALNFRFFFSENFDESVKIMNDINPIRDDNDMLNIEQQIASNDESGTQVAHDEHYKKGAQFAHGEYFEKDAFSAIPTYPSNQPEPIPLSSQPEQIHLSSHSESIHPSSQPKSTQNVDISKKSSSSDEVKNNSFSQKGPELPPMPQKKTDSGQQKKVISLNLP